MIGMSFMDKLLSYLEKPKKKKEKIILRSPKLNVHTKGKIYRNLIEPEPGIGNRPPPWVCF